MPENIILLRHPLSHIGKYSGYENYIERLSSDQLKFIHVHRLRAVKKSDIQRRLFLRRQDKKMINKPGLYYNVFSYMAEMEALKTLKKNAAKLVHNTHVEDNHGYLGNYKSQNGFSIVATAHQPFAWWKYTHKSTAALEKLDALFTLSSIDAEYFERIIPGRVRLTKHAVATDFFRITKPIKERSSRIIFVGNWLRDVSFFVTVSEKLLHNNPALLIDIVCRTSGDMNIDPVFRLCKYNQVTLHQGISNEALCELYNDARLLFLPLIDSTANNAILEAASCGVPIVTTNLPAVKEYTNSSYAYYYTSEKDCIDYITDSISRNIDLQQKSLAARKNMEENYTLDIVAAEHIDLYKSFI